MLVGRAEAARGLPANFLINVKAHSHDRQYLRSEGLVNDRALNRQNLSLEEANASLFKLSWIRVDLAHRHAQPSEDQAAHGAQHSLDTNVTVEVVGRPPLLLGSIFLKIFATGASIVNHDFCSE